MELTESYVVKALNFDGVTKIEVAVYQAHPKRGRVATGKRVRIRADKALEVAMLLIEAHGAIQNLVPGSMPR